MLRASIALASSVLLAGTAGSASAEDGGRGATLAHTWCQNCHVVSASQTSTVATQAPPFSEIARRKDLDGTRLSFFLNAPHPPMPQMQLTRSDADDLAAYIKEQGKK
jgi:mono/diheme cytochrome c family protein